MEREILLNGWDKTMAEIRNFFAERQAGEKIYLEGSFMLSFNDISNEIHISAPNLTVDASRAVFYVNQNFKPGKSCAIIHIDSGASNFCLTGLKLNYRYCSLPCRELVSAVITQAENTLIEKTELNMSAQERISLAGILNSAGAQAQTHGLTVRDCRINLSCLSDNAALSGFVCGIINRGGKGMSCKDNYIFAQNKGNGEGHFAIGIYNSGSEALLDNNNIKANGSHNLGFELEQCRACGAMDAGSGSVWSYNNIVGEWGGECSAFICEGENIRITGNKLLGTHTIKGRTVKIKGNGCTLDHNIITTTSRNPRLIEVTGADAVIASNMLDAVLGQWWDYFSACGIYFDKAANGRAENNHIMILKNCGIFLNNCEAVLKNNTIMPNNAFADYLPTADNSSARMLDILDERRIRSITAEQQPKMPENAW